ncbi:formate dehydrogenase accessory sulfurtransferase FdhD [Desulfotruncus alcoholivorax]|uniref:formate dehydrogenase accessory sulfurtransferase FdhD n=1 Tax=Desulfotruncus alcoholivorax TaxID=265477 RepID=UPI000429C3D5|nr:formate dehydrogenase accessory sulfurtransferase FdhD [Desulfotruncus alcoholivorax]
MNDRKIITVEKILGSSRDLKEDLVVRETAITLYVNEIEMVTMICTPTHLRELCLGFLFAESMIDSANDVAGFEYNENDGLAWVETAKPVNIQNNFLKRHIASCCGRGRASFYFINDLDIRPITSEAHMQTAEIFALRSETERRSELFAATGGAHGAALGYKGDVIAFFEDVGRHNALDKIAGWCLLHGINTGDKQLVFSGRVSSEIVLKTARLGVPVIISRSAPTDLALELAGQLNVTVVGFARGNRMNIYTAGQRITV